MPYTSKKGRMQLASSLGHVPIVESPFIREKRASFRCILPEDVAAPDAGLLVSADSLAPEERETRWALAFDGSSQEVPLREEFPSTRIGYLQVAGVLVDLRRLRGQGDAHLVDPVELKRSVDETLQSIVMPSSNVCGLEHGTVRDSWRAEVFALFSTYELEGRKLLEILRTIIDHSEKAGANGVVVARCPSRECDARELDVPYDASACPECGTVVYPTDVLRLHEEVSEAESNLTSIGRLMTIMEHLSLVGYLDFLAARSPGSLSAVMFILDGPLAVFGPQAWIQGAIREYLAATRAALAERNLAFPLIVGIEKTGHFPEHLAALGEARVPRRTLMKLPDEYIYSRILTFREPTICYGSETYYGTKFFYRTARGEGLTITVPKPGDDFPDHYEPKHYPEIGALLRNLDRLGTTLYEDALIPVALAHSYAAIPLRTGSRVLKLLSLELLDG